MRHPAAVLTAISLLILSAAVGCAPIPTGYDGVVEAPSLDKATQLAMIEEQLQEEAKSFGLEGPPEVAIVRIVELNEWLDTIIACMTDAGFPVQKTPDGEGVSYSAVAPNLAEQLDLAQYICDAQYPVNPVYSVPLNDSQLKFLYWYFTGPLTTCLREHGYEPQTGPSYTTFAETYEDPGKTWSPYRDLIETSNFSEDMTVLFRECPQLPDDNDLYATR